MAAVTVAAPLVGVLVAALGPDAAAIAGRDLARYAVTSAWLALLVAILTAAAGTLAAWLVAMHQFPARGLMSWALALPLAMPAFALAYGYADLFDVAGPIRIALREHIGVDLPFEMRSVGGAAFVLSAAFYPYVYLTMRAAFASQSVTMLEAARMLDCSGWRALWRVALPLARPALAAGVALAVMETLADYGAVRFLSVQTLTTGIVRAWTTFGSTAEAARLALPLLAVAAVLLWMERWTRSGRAHDAGQSRWRTLDRTPLRGGAAWLACAYCLLLLCAGLLIPTAWLIWNMTAIAPDWPRLAGALQNSLMLGLAGSIMTVALATMLALGTRRLPIAARLASLGYATPGAVMAIGLLAPAGIVWTIAPGAGMGIALGLLVLAYAARLMAAALEPIDAGFARVTPSMAQAARTLGRSEAGAAFAVDLPIARGALLTAALIVFIDIAKELPATLILRPFDFDTLAVLASNYALDERLGQAGVPSLLIVGMSLPMAIWLAQRVARSGAGI